MSHQEQTVHGEIQSDGTLKLSEKLSLPIGPVEIVIRPLAPTSVSQPTWWDQLQQSRKQVEEQGVGFRTEQEVNDYLNDLREEDDRIDSFYNQSDSSDKD